MVEPSNKTVTEQITATFPTGTDKSLATVKIPQITIDTFREIQLAILDNLSADANNVNDP
jgi:hypothetical protein